MISPTLEADLSGISTPPELMNEPIKEIQFDVRYQPKHIGEGKRRVMIEYNNCLSRNRGRENLQEYCHIEVRKEDRIRFQIQSYCYDINQDKESIFNKNLKARLYDKEGNILAEDYLRCERDLDGTETCHKRTSPSLNIYLPYSKKAYKVKVIKIDGEKEIVLNEQELLSYKEIKNSKDYFEGSNCHAMYIMSIY
ncbi:MAG: hypothetical protein OXJ52_05700 [Oligoflexia bacterium]|nr:hypothetical protein [Oligoflexia bacterium]